MNRRKLITAASVVVGGVGLVGLMGLADYFGVIGDDDDDDDDGQALTRALRGTKVSLQDGLTVGEQEGRPIAAKFEIDRGSLQLSVYTANEGKFSEVLVDAATGKVLNVEPITRPEQL